MARNDLYECMYDVSKFKHTSGAVNLQKKNGTKYTELIFGFLD